MSGVGVYLTEKTAKKILEEGWKDYKKEYQRGSSISWCSEENCVNVFRKGREYCVNVSRPCYPYLPKFETCSKDIPGILTTALIYMDMYSRLKREKAGSYAELMERAIKDFLKTGDAKLAVVGDEYPYDALAPFIEFLQDQYGLPRLSYSEEHKLKEFLKSALKSKTLANLL